MNRVQIAPNTYWVGKVDDRKVPFHRLILEKGTTYNSYLLMAKKPTVIDTVDIEFGREYVENLSQIIDPGDLAYIVINHVEPDHAGALPALAAKAKNAVIVTTALGAELLKDMFRLHHREFLVVRDGDTLDIGGKTLKFFETPFLHTEETMVTYAVEDEVLYPCDQFSTHLATEKLFNDLSDADITEDFEVYYQLIMHPHRPYVRTMLEKVKALPIRVIAPSHGFILRDNPQQYIDLYDEMSSLNGKGEDKSVVIIYSTMTGNTTKIVQRLRQGLEGLGVDVTAFNLKNADFSDVKAAVSESDGVLIGSSTRYADMVGPLESLLKELDSDVVDGKLAAAFGSYGWSGEAVVHVDEYLEKLGFDVLNQARLIKGTGVDTALFPLRVRFAREEDLDRAEEAGRTFAEHLVA